MKVFDRVRIFGSVKMKKHTNAKGVVTHTLLNATASNHGTVPKGTHVVILASGHDKHARDHFDDCVVVKLPAAKGTKKKK